VGDGRRSQTSRGSFKITSVAGSRRLRKESLHAVPTPQSLAEVNAERSADLSGFNPFKRLRGGESDTKLTREEIVEKLNRVPTFCLVDAAENAIAIPNEDGGHDVCWFLDAAEAQDLLELTVEANPDAKGIHLAVSPLGAVFDLCGGFKGLKGQKTSKTPLPFKGGTLKLCGPRTMLASSESALQEQLRKQGIKPGEWVLPVLCHNDLQAEDLMPFFFDSVDFKAGWSQAYGEDKAMPDNVAIMDLRLLTNQMLNSGGFDWRKCQFVTSMQAMKVAGELQAAAKAKAATAADNEEDSDAGA